MAGQPGSEAGGITPQTGGTPPPVANPQTPPVAEPSVDITTSAISEPSQPEINFRYSEGTSMDEFFKDFPQYKENPNFNKYKTVKALAEGHENIISRLGTAINLPNEYSTPDQINEFYTKLGRPEAMDKYTHDDKLPEGYSIDETLDTTYREKAFELGLSQKQYSALRDFHNQAVIAADKQHKEAVQTQLANEHQDNVKAIQEMWGPDYKQKTQIAIGTAKRVLSQQTLDYLDATGLGNNASLVADFYKLSQVLSGDGRPKGDDYISTEPSLDEMNAEALKIIQIKNWDKDPKLVKKYQELTQHRADIQYS